MIEKLLEAPFLPNHHCLRSSMRRAMERRRMSTTASPIKNKKHARKIPAIAPEESWWEVVAPVVLDVVDGSLGELPMPV